MDFNSTVTSVLAFCVGGPHQVIASRSAGTEWPGSLNLQSMRPECGEYLLGIDFYCCGRCFRHVLFKVVSPHSLRFRGVSLGEELKVQIDWS
jgi:hypothetical protein